MGDLVNNQGGIIDLFHHGQEGGLPKPYEHEIFLFDTRVAGTTHIDGIDELVPHLEIGERLGFYREPDNKYDNKAIAIKTNKGIKIGFVPQNDNLIFARLMDAGKLLFARISEKQVKGTWVIIGIKVFLQD